MFLFIILQDHEIREVGDREGMDVAVDESDDDVGDDNAGFHDVDDMEIYKIVPLSLAASKTWSFMLQLILHQRIMQVCFGAGQAYKEW